MPDAKREQVLSVRDLDITFKTTAGPVHAIRGVNIDLYKGETVALVGESGSGKSVTMKAAMGISCVPPVFAQMHQNPLIKSDHCCRMAI